MLERYGDITLAVAPLGVVPLRILKLVLSIWNELVRFIAVCVVLLNVRCYDWILAILFLVYFRVLE